MTNQVQRIFTLFLISQNVAVLSSLVMLVVGLIDIQNIWKPSDRETPS